MSEDGAGSTGSAGRTAGAVLLPVLRGRVAAAERTGRRRLDAAAHARAASSCRSPRIGAARPDRGRIRGRAMTGYPIELDLTGRQAVVVGGGPVALRRTQRCWPMRAPR